jgi:hypothetical protein
MNTRREFIKQATAASILATIPGGLIAKPVPPPNKVWAGLLHLSFNFAAGIAKYGGLREEFEPNEVLWNDALRKMANSGMNVVLINLDDSVKWHSHPEIAVRNAWTPERLREELAKIRKLGLEPIPMLNFSSTHDAWMKEYSRMLSTDKYYGLCKDLIAEAIDIFDKPRFFHLGLDEETEQHQRHFDYTVIRKNDLWWADFYFQIGEVMKGGARPWIWSDYVWHNPETFYKKMPKSVIQSNWYYQDQFDLKTLTGAKKTYVSAYLDLESHGYDQIPTSSNDQNITTGIGNTVKFCSEHIADARLMGFLQTFWKPTIEEYRGLIMEGIELMGASKKWYDQNKKS